MEKTKKSEYKKEVVKILIVYVVIVAVALLMLNKAKISVKAEQLDSANTLIYNYAFRMDLHYSKDIYYSCNLNFSSDREIIVFFMPEKDNRLAFGTYIDGEFRSMRRITLNTTDSWSNITVSGTIAKCNNYSSSNREWVEGNGIANDIEKDNCISLDIIDTGMKIFSTLDYAKNYFNSGVVDGLLNSVVNADSLHDTSIGYLSNLTVDYLQVNEEKAYHQFTWNNTSTSGLDLTQDNIKIECWVSYVGAWTDGLFATQNDVNYKIYDKKFYAAFHNSKKPLIINETELQNDLFVSDMAHFDEHYSITPLANGVVKDTYKAYFRIVRTNNDGTISYGNFLTYDIRLGFTDYIQTEDKDGNQTFDNEEVGSGQDYNSGSGVGETLEDAQQDASTNNNQSNNLDFDFDSLLENTDNLGEWFINLINTLFSAMGKVPQMIANTLVFLPKEIMLFLSAGIVIVVILRIFGR